jgi:hypothetical protein
LVWAVLSSINPVAADDGFYVVATGAVGTKIASVPYAISAPGFYYLGGNLTYSGTGSAISVNADNVTLDLMGFSLTGAGKTVSNCGINPNVNQTPSNNMEVRNGTVNGFGSGIVGAGNNIRVSRIRAFNNGWGIWVAGSNPLIEGCISSNNDHGILLGSGRISGCVANNNTEQGIALNGPGEIIGNVANNNGQGFGYSDVDAPLLVDRNSASGNGTNYQGTNNTKIVWGRNAGNPPHLDYPLPY